MMIRAAGGPGAVNPIDFGERRKPIPRWLWAAIGVSALAHVAAGVVLYNQRFELNAPDATQPDTPPVDVTMFKLPEPKPLPPTVTPAISAVYRAAAISAFFAVLATARIAATSSALKPSTAHVAST